MCQDKNRSYMECGSCKLEVMTNGPIYKPAPFPSTLQSQQSKDSDNLTPLQIHRRSAKDVFDKLSLQQLTTDLVKHEVATTTKAGGAAD